MRLNMTIGKIFRLVEVTLHTINHTAGSKTPDCFLVSKHTAHTLKTQPRNKIVTRLYSLARIDCTDFENTHCPEANNNWSKRMET